MGLIFTSGPSLSSCQPQRFVRQANAEDASGSAVKSHPHVSGGAKGLNKTSTARRLTVQPLGREGKAARYSELAGTQTWHPPNEPHKEAGTTCPLDTPRLPSTPNPFTKAEGAGGRALLYREVN